MNKLNTYLLLFIVAGLLGVACDTEDNLINTQLEENPLPNNEFVFSSGDADFTTFVTIGNSLTAGYMDGALYTSGQQNSMAAMIAGAAGVTNFNQPDINSANGFNTVVENPQGSLVLGRFKLDTSIPGPSPVINGDPIAAYTGATSELNNFAVPGIVVGQLLTPATGGPASPANPAYNPFYARFASSPSADGATGSTILSDVLSTNPTFFTLWIGSNDVLGYAASGGANDAILTDPADFEMQYNGVIATLMSSSADGIVANIPFFLGLPLFQAVPYNAIPIESQAQADALNNGYSDYNNGLATARIAGLIDETEEQRRRIEFSLGANAFVMEDESLTDLTALGLPNYRQSESTDIVMLSAAAAFPNGVGTQTAAGDQYVLIPQEQELIEIRRAQFNGTIANAVSANSGRIGLYDAASQSGVFYDLFGLSDGVPGIRVSGVDLAPDFSPAGVLSTDGVHPNRRGYAILANEFLKAIEDKFNANLPSVDVLAEPSVQVCNGDCASEQ